MPESRSDDSMSPQTEAAQADGIRAVTVRQPSLGNSSPRSSVPLMNSECRDLFVEAELSASEAAEAPYVSIRPGYVCQKNYR